MSGAQLAVLPDEEKSDQIHRAIAVSNRLTIIGIKLKRANIISDVYRTEIKEIGETINFLMDSLLLGEDVRSDLGVLEQRATQVEQSIGV
jgi:hypothetical protein